tara:strand:+ start:911 stop:1090 length:180 start_codon:yes stop_codon:yes gene_type:complete
MKKLTQEQVNKKYKGKYVEFLTTYCYEKRKNFYEIIRASKIQRENTSLGEHVGTDKEYT